MSALSQRDFDYLVRSYREWHAFDANRSAADTRKALKRIQATLDAAAASIGEFTQGGMDIGDETPARAAWRRINAVAAERQMRSRPLVSAESVAGILSEWSTAARIAHDGLPRKHQSSALRMIAGRLWSWPGFECKATKNGRAVAILIKIAKAAGDLGVHEDAAVDDLKATKPK